MNDRQEEMLQGSVQTGGMLEDFVRHPGFQILRKELESKVNDARNEWLKAKTPDEAERIRIKTQPYQEVLDLLTHKILQGRVAQSQLNAIKEELQ